MAAAAACEPRLYPVARSHGRCAEGCRLLPATAFASAQAIRSRPTAAHAIGLLAAGRLSHARRSRATLSAVAFGRRDSGPRPPNASHDRAAIHGAHSRLLDVFRPDGELAVGDVSIGGQTHVGT